MRAVILYLHGFQSSPLSYKAQMLAGRMRELGLIHQYICPQLPASPRKSIELALQLMASHAPGEVTLIGSSLGGYYANWLAEKTGCRAVLLNPVVDPVQVKIPKGAAQEVMQVQEWVKFIQSFKAEIIDLRAVPITQPGRYFLIAAKGDELLDWKKMSAHYKGAYQQIMEGGDHVLSGFEQYVDMVLSFCGIAQ